MVRQLLDKKLRRDLRRHLGSLVAIAVVVACGIAAFVGMRTMVHVLADAQAAYYARSGFPDVFTRVRRAPQSVLPALRDIPGVAQLQARASGEVVVRVPGLAEPATLRIVGLGDVAPTALNRVVVRAGRLPLPEETDAVTVSEGFAEANALAVGDTLGAVIGGAWRRLYVVGIGISAEFVYELRPGDMLPDPKRYGVLWLPDRMAQRTFDLDQAWNELALRLAPRADTSAVIAALDAALRRYGSLGATTRALHPSHQFLESEIDENRTFATVLPAIFLAVAAFLVHLVLSRVVIQQRDQIGTLKAFGVPTAALARHYVLFALAPVALGCVGGVALGTWLAAALSGIYQDFFRFPALSAPVYPRVIAAGIGIGVVAALIGALGALRRVLRLPPAEAMRPEPPARYASGLVERLLGRHGSPLTRMVARGMTHRPWRTALSSIGIGFGAAVVVVGTFGFDAIERMQHVLFDVSTRADVSVVFGAPRGREVAAELLAMPGVLRVELSRSAAARASHGHRNRQTAVIGVDPDAQLRQVADLEARVLSVPEGGVTLSGALSRVLAAGVGDTVDLEFLDGRGHRTSQPVAAVVEDLTGSAVYVPSHALAGLVGAGEAVTSADLQVDRTLEAALFDRLVRAPGVQAIIARDRMRESFDATVRQSFHIVLTTLVLVAAALAAGTTYNAGRVTLSERARDLASLRVLGFTRGEAARILFGELGVLGAIGLPLGIVIGIGFAWATVQSLGRSEMFRMPLVIGPRTIAMGLVVPVIAGALSVWPLRRQLDRLDLIESLKTRE